MNNTTRPSAEIEEIFTKEIWLLYYIICGLLISTGTITNCHIIYFYWTRKIPQTHFNYCLMLLSVLNILQYVGILPYLAIPIEKVATRNYYVQSVMCGIIEGPNMFFAAANTTVFMLSFISVTRYHIIVRPFKRRVSQRTTKKMLIGFSLFTILLIVPNSLNWRLKPGHDYCVRTNYFNALVNFVYRGVLFGAGIVIPVVTMTFTYLMTIFALYSSHATPAEKSKRKHRKHVIQVLGALIAIYLLCWLPFGIYWILNSVGYYGKSVPADYRSTRVGKFVFVPCISAGFLNALSYGITNKQFQAALQKVYFGKRKFRNGIRTR